MLAEAELREYLDEIRQTVCSRCVERPEGGPPCTPLGKPCGVELHLEKLVESVREVHSPLVEPYLCHNRDKVCGSCPHLHGEHCPCPMDTLAALVIDAIEAVDERHARRERGRQWLSGLPGDGTAALEAIDRAYEEGAGAWSGCDWPTAFGRARLDLQGISAAEAEARAVESIWRRQGQLWEEAAEWLRRLEARARLAEEQASLAVAAAHRGEWAEALAHARQAWALEVNSGRTLWTDALAWRPLYWAIEAAASGWPVASAEGGVS
jgi:hypothetical protein